MAESEKVLSPEDVDDSMQTDKEPAVRVKTEERKDETLKKPFEEAEKKQDEAAISDAAVLVAPITELNFRSEESFEKKGFAHWCYKFVKRSFDIVSSLVAIIILSPIILICLLIKWLEDGKNPIYTQERVGKNGKLFKFHKIRSMVVGAENMKQKLIEEGLNEADGPAFKMKNDPRVTRFGKFLRKSSFDELLQLFDIFVGNMSVVGPRPPLPREVKNYTEYQKHRCDVKGGLLCLWQIQHNRNALSFDEWVDLDIEYIKKQSILLDLKIIFKGAYMVLFDRSGE